MLTLISWQLGNVLQREHGPPDTSQAGPKSERQDVVVLHRRRYIPYYKLDRLVARLSVEERLFQIWVWLYLADDQGKIRYVS